MVWAKNVSHRTSLDQEEERFQLIYTGHTKDAFGRGRPRGEAPLLRADAVNKPYTTGRDPPGNLRITTHFLGG